WRLPTLEELRSLIETTASSAPKLPSGHPFTNPQTTDSYWTTTVNAATSLFIVNLDGRAPVSEDTSVGTNTNFAWCVRGSPVADGAKPLFSTDTIPPSCR